LTPALRERDREERITISEELGRCRLLALLTCDLKLLEQLFRWLAPRRNPVPGPLDKSHSDCAAARRAFNGSRKSRVGSASPSPPCSRGAALRLATWARRTLRRLRRGKGSCIASPVRLGP
jgi:hypothetical protein